MTFTIRSRRSLGRGIEKDWLLGLKHRHPILAYLVWVVCYPAAVVLIWFGTVILTGQIVQRAIIIHLYGAERYASGLHVIRKNGLLSDGSKIGAGWNYLRVAGSGIPAIAAVMMYIYACSRLGIREIREPAKLEERNGHAQA